MLITNKMVHCGVVFCMNDSPYKNRFLKESGKQLHFHQLETGGNVIVSQLETVVKRRKKWIVAIRRDEGKNLKVFYDLYFVWSVETPNWTPTDIGPVLLFGSDWVVPLIFILIMLQKEHDGPGWTGQTELRNRPIILFEAHHRAVQWHYIDKLSNDTVPNHTL